MPQRRLERPAYGLGKRIHAGSVRDSLQLTASYCKSLQGAASIGINRGVGHLVTACIYLHQLTRFISHLLSHTSVGQTLSMPRRAHCFLRFKRVPCDRGCYFPPRPWRVEHVFKSGRKSREVVQVGIP
jgi:hypothetical protein